MTLKWTMESVIAAGAVVVTAAGSVWTTSYHAGQTQQHLQQLDNGQAQIEARVSSHDMQLDELKQHDAKIEQKLDDVSGTVHDIQDHVDHERH